MTVDPDAHQGIEDETSAEPFAGEAFWPRFVRGFRARMSANTDENVSTRCLMGVATIIVAVYLDLLPFGFLLYELLVGDVTLDSDNAGAFAIVAAAVPFFLTSTVAAVWHLVRRRSPLAWRLFKWNMSTFAIGLVTPALLSRFIG